MGAGIWRREIQIGGEEKSKWYGEEKSKSGDNRPAPCITAPCNYFVENMIESFSGEFSLVENLMQSTCLRITKSTESARIRQILNGSHEKSWYSSSCIYVWFVTHLCGTILLQCVNQYEEVVMMMVTWCNAWPLWLDPSRRDTGEWYDRLKSGNLYCC